MTASLDERAKRRFAQLGEGHSLEQIRREIAARDQQDQNRDSAPMVQAEDAVVFDTSALSISEAIDELARLLKDHGLT